VIVLQFNDLHFIMTTVSGTRMHVAFWTPVALCLIKAVGVIAIHAIVKIYQHPTGEGKIDSYGK